MNEQRTWLSGAVTADPQAVTRIAGGAPADRPPHGIPPGTLLVNTYEVERLLGGGGMGEVYLARHTGLGTLHAVKVIRPSMAADRQVMDLFYREAKVLRGVRHDAVVNYDGFVRDAEGRDYLVMEYVEGPSLGERLRRGPLAVEEVLVLRDRLAGGLAQAHRQGAVHRDISPDNVILPGERVAAAKLIDFGLTKLTDPGQETIIGASFAGKFRYASPEQFGMFGGAVDARSDIYSLGLTLAAAALGRPLDMGNSFEAALRTRQTGPDLAALSETLRPWFAAMLEPDPARRPASLDEILSRWPGPTQVFVAPHGPPVQAPGPMPTAPASSVRGASGDAPAPRPRALWLGVGGALVAVAGLGLYLILRPLASPPTGPGLTVPASSEHQPPPGNPAGPAESAAAGSPAMGLQTLVQTDRIDEALTAAQVLIAANANVPEGTRSPLPVEVFLELARRLRAAGRPGDAFVPVEALIGAGATPLADTIWPLAEDLHATGRLDHYLFLVRFLANRGYGPAALAYGELYDPLHWSTTTSPFTKPRADKARDWYEKAAALGVPEARARLAALKSAARGPDE